MTKGRNVLNIFINDSQSVSTHVCVCTHEGEWMWQNVSLVGLGKGCVNAHGTILIFP